MQVTFANFDLFNAPAYFGIQLHTQIRLKIMLDQINIFIKTNLQCPTNQDQTIKVGGNVLDTVAKEAKLPALQIDVCLT